MLAPANSPPLAFAALPTKAKGDIQPARAAVAPPEPTPVERGRYLVQIASCNDCHTYGMRQMFDGIKQMAEAAGRDPSALQMVVRADLELAEHPLGPDRMIFTGTLDQIQSDIEGCRTMGTHEIILDPTFSAGAQRLDRWLESMERLRHLA